MSRPDGAGAGPDAGTSSVARSPVTTPLPGPADIGRFRAAQAGTHPTISRGGASPESAARATRR